jgi:hypothetical protein
MMDAILGQARELQHGIFILFLDLKQFFPAIKRESRKAAEYFIGLPEDRPARSCVAAEGQNQVV